MKTKEQILAHISSVPANEKKLKVLKFGCEVEATERYGCYLKNDYKGCFNLGGEWYRRSNNENTRISDGDILRHFTILGIPPELPELLVAIQNLECKECHGQGGKLGESLGYMECEECGGDGYLLPEELVGTGFDISHVIDMYDLSLTLSENLDRPEFLKFISNILK